MVAPLSVNYKVHGFLQEMDYHSHPERYEIYIFHAGSCKYLISNQIYNLQPGDILIMDGMSLHKPNISRTSEYIRSTIHFSPEYIMGVLNELGCKELLDPFKQLRHQLIRAGQSKKFQDFIEIIFKLNDVHKNESVKLHKEVKEKILLIEALLHIYEFCENSNPKFIREKTEKEIHAENIADYIQKNYAKKLNLDHIANALNLSKSYISHVFKEMTGFTIMEYLQSYRLSQVKYLIETEHRKTLHEIASSCGFESPSHFSRYFREKVGMTAGEYRKRYRRTAN